MKVFLSSDMEGTAGVVDWQQCVGDGPEAAAGRALLLAEVNAAIEGAVAGGATEIVVNDSHSTHAQPPCRRAGRRGVLHLRQPQAALHDAGPGRQLRRGDVRVLPRLGGAPAGLSHTYNPRAVIEARLGGVVTGEAGINALVAAHYGVPVVLVTGDRCACAETAALIPGVHAAVVKEHVSRLAAHSLHPARACALIRETAQRAIEGAAGAQPSAGGLGHAGDLRPHHRHRRGGGLDPWRGAHGAPRTALRRRGSARRVPQFLRGDPADPRGCGGGLTSSTRLMAGDTGGRPPGFLLHWQQRLGCPSPSYIASTGSHRQAPVSARLQCFTRPEP